MGVIHREVCVHGRLAKSIVCLGSEGIVVNVADSSPGSSRSSISNEPRAGGNGAVCPTIVGGLRGNDGNSALGLDGVDSVLNVVCPGMDQNLLPTEDLG